MNENEYRGHRHFYFGWAIIGFLAIIATITAISWIFFRPVPYAGPYYFFPFGGFFAIFWIIGVFFAIRWLFWGGFWGGRWGYYPSRRYWRHYDEAYAILRERYAKGEITKDQYDEMMRNLQSTNH